MNSTEIGMDSRDSGLKKGYSQKLHIVWSEIGFGGSLCEKIYCDVIQALGHMSLQ